MPMPDYDEFRKHVQAELLALQADKELLLEERRSIEGRLDAINRHEAKLQSVVDSLIALLAVAADRLAETDAAVSAIAAATATPETHDAPESAIAEAPQSATEPTADAAAAVIESEPTSEPPSGLLLIETAGAAGEPNAIIAPPPPSLEPCRITSTPVPAVAATPPLVTAIELPRVKDFAANDFFRRFPHVANTHPVHLLAAKLLEYFGYGLKLAEIARLIERLGYRHSSQNFTDSVHSALKNKRKATGEFRFNRTTSVWELARWQNNHQTANDANPAANVLSAAASDHARAVVTARADEIGKASTTLLTRQVETRIARELAKPRTGAAQTLSGDTPAPAPGKRRPEATGERGGTSGIRVYKLQK